MDPDEFDQKSMATRTEMLLFFAWHRKRERELNRLASLNAKYFPRG